MNRLLKNFLTLILVLILVAGGGFIWYVNDYYHATDAARELLTDTRVTQNGKYITITPTQPSDTAIIFYPGGKVEAEAYLPLMMKLADQGITCVLIEMPFNLAVFDQNAADGVYPRLATIDHIYLMGHSLGGAMASSYFANQNRLDGLILLGAYIYGDVDPDQVLTIYGSEDIMLDKTKVTGKNVVVIDGANHAQFGDYGIQEGDGEATMSREKQQSITVALIKAFMSTKK